MSAILYYLSLPFLYGLSRLPFPVLYRISDLLFFLFYRILGYRKEVVTANLRNAFPAKDETEIRRIRRRFYRYFGDLVLESLKTLTIGEEALKRVVKVENFGVVRDYFEKKQSIIFVLGHQGNWELAGARFSLEPVHRLMTIYHPLKDPRFEKLIYHMRTRLGNGLYPMPAALRGMLRDRDQLTATAFIADQTPSSRNVHWMEFLQQETPVFEGPEKIARKLGYPVLYMSVRREGRGRYVLRPEVLFDDPRAAAPNEITETYTRRLEADIRRQPEVWLWTHRRWKHRREGGAILQT